jgi:hypothetical protein
LAILKAESHDFGESRNNVGGGHGGVHFTNSVGVLQVQILNLLFRLGRISPQKESATYNDHEFG